MTRIVVDAIITAAAAALLVCTTAFATGVAIDLAVTGLLHLPMAITATLGAVILGADGWLGVWLFRNAFAAERRLASGEPSSG